MDEVSVFISYRRDTDAARAVTLHYMIAGTFNRPDEPPRVRIYRDTAERLGKAWPQEVHDRCAAADIVLVVIGPGWLEAVDQYSRRRIDQEDDWVRREIEVALDGDKTVIPIVFERSDVPPAEALPASIADLTNRRGVLVRDEFPEQLQPVLREIELHFPVADAQHARGDVGAGPGRLPYPHPPLVVRPEPMSPADLTIALDELLTDWEVVRSRLPEDPGQVRVELHTTLEFRSFLEVMRFMAEVAEFADKANHHPRWENIYKTLRVYLTTWDIGHRPSHFDVQLAQYVDRVYRSYCD